MRRLEKDYAAAIKDFDEALRLEPRHAGAYSNRCTVRAIVGQLKEAVAAEVTAQFGRCAGKPWARQPQARPD
jgi:tetratricopeptide (TPR) repeat protein